MNLTYFGHATFQVEIKGKKILFDPFVTYNELAKGKVDVNTIEADYIFLSHGHQDHVADAAGIATRTGAKVVAVWEVCTWMQNQGVDNVHHMNTGGKWTFDFGTVKTVVAQHSSSFPDGSYAGNPVGFVFKTDEGNFYYSGDTALTLDMQLIPDWVVPDFAVLPIGDDLTMGADDAVRAAQMVKTKKVVGVHYDTFGYIKLDKDAARSTFSKGGIALELPAIGQTIKL
ncbi:metal-dependent hydrolase [Dinghuibacter silviterrae]|uniref:L-ascorbate metabolism protein UlaG (Beta-lactamase superfamily) n=1 Tax=Dinghuibacter silviterrae TaxID=1539049 RepID=A0A4R8DEZ4_9BACT|nr:metal-dependent hydrolase [Dinghuibacter silviterrae]TDW96015.1 L-ascorbate metabolism protein UlaG (beta-lactamase superfamily) [Dinghuibacter silviterrae]